MSEARIRSLMHNGVTALKHGELNSARNYFERALYSARDHDILADLWFYLSEVESDEEKKRHALDEALSYRMTHPRARRSLAILNGTLQVDEIVDSDRIAAPDASDRETNAERFDCPNCGGMMSFSPDGQSLVCDFCAVENAAEEEEAKEQDFFSAMATLRGHSKPVARKVFHCEGCGAEFLLAADNISAACAYCASPHVVHHGERRDLLDPDAIIPHAFDKSRAIQILVAWVKENNFTPQGKVLPPRGLYIPVWTFDIGGSISYRGERPVEENSQQGFGFKTEKVYVTERGDLSIFVDDLIIPAANKYERYLHSFIESYNLRETKSYDRRYLSNWSAETYEVELSKAALEARSRAYNAEKKKIKRSMYNLRNFSTSSADLAITSYKLLLLPLWMTTYPYEGEDHTVLINGQNGEVYGEMPEKVKKANGNGGIMSWLDDVLDF
jgi:hypothetical protein